MKNIVYFGLIFTFVLAQSAFAYLDPNSGSGLIAFLVAILAGIAFYFKKIFYGIKRIFTGGKKDETPQENSEDNKDKQ